MLNSIGCASNICSKYTIPIIVRNILYFPKNKLCSIINQNIDLSKFRNRSIHQFFNFLFLGHISWDKNCISPWLRYSFNSFFSSSFINICYHNFRAFLRKQLANRSSNSRWPASNYCNFLFKSHNFTPFTNLSDI